MISVKCINTLVVCMVAFVLVLLLLAGCKPPARESFGNAEAAERAGNFQLAVQDYGAVVGDHPSDSLAAVAQFKIASIQQNNLGDFPAAIASYRRYVELYPSTPQTATATFLIAYVYNNEMHNIDSAAAWYGRFLEAYPGHEMAPSAKFEIQNLGKTPEELLPPEPATRMPGKAAGKDRTAR